jgi:3-dehydro-L-gulonate 2-dehydrogenase
MRVGYQELQETLARILRKLGFSAERAGLCARLFAEASRDGVPSHGLNRFPRFVEQVKRRIVDVQAAPVRVAAFGALERWDGKSGPGNLNAHAAMDRAITLARDHGLGCVALSNTNHWMRGGSYGWQAADAGLIGICWTNTMANLPPWGAPDARIGNNPLILAVPRRSGAVVLDMAMSQFSYGALESYRRRGELLPVEGGFDPAGQLTRDPAAIEASQRPLPIGFWKGSGLSILLDMVGALLSGGLPTHQIKTDVIAETRLTQVFLAFDPSTIDTTGSHEQVIDGILASLRGPAGSPPVRYPGERVHHTRAENLVQGIPVDPRIWEQVQALSGHRPPPGS